jgi:rare lipoprotein A
VARINDRGPFVRGRIVDLSLAAAQLLGIEEAGVARVRLTVVDPALAPPTVFWVQVGAFREEANARTLLTDLSARYPDAAIEASADWYRVRVPSGPQRGAAKALRRDLVRAGYEAIVVSAPMPPQPRSNT